MIFILEDNNERIENFKAALALEHIDSHVEKTVPESIEWLSKNEGCIIFSLDNDLYVPDYDGNEGEGWMLCKWIVANMTKRPVLIHSSNINAVDKMKGICEKAGWDCNAVPPYNDVSWIHESWIKAIKNIGLGHSMSHSSHLVD